jgi:hypothetical protein
MMLTTTKETVPATIRAMLGPPALLPSEDAAIYEATLAHFAGEVAPRDLITWMLIKDLADHRLEIARHIAGFGKTLRRFEMIEGEVLDEEAM